VSTRLFKYAPGLQPACDRAKRAGYAMSTKQIPAEIKARIVQMLDGFDFQTGAIHAIEEVEQWLADNQLVIKKEEPCVSQSPAPAEPSAATSSSP
jgi:hypothetical protein